MENLSYYSPIRRSADFEAQEPLDDATAHSETQAVLIPSASELMERPLEGAPPTLVIYKERIKNTGLFVPLGERAVAAWQKSTMRQKIAVFASAAVTASLATPTHIFASKQPQREPIVASKSQVIQERGESFETGGYRWADAQYLGPAKVLGYPEQPVWGYKDCPPSAPNCKNVTVKVNGITYGILDPYGDPFRWCSSFVKDELRKADVDPRRFAILNTHSLESLAEKAKNSGEVVDENPTPGSVLLWPEGNHMWIVRAVDGDVVTVDDYNSGLSGGPGRFGRETMTRSQIFPNAKVVHLEKPAPKLSELQKASYDRANKNRLRLNAVLHDGMYINEGSISLLLSNGVLKFYDSSTGSDKLVWKTPTSGQGAEVLVFRKVKPGHNKLQLIAPPKNPRSKNPMKRKPRVVWERDMKKSTKVELRSNGTFVGVTKGRVSAVIASVKHIQRTH